MILKLRQKNIKKDVQGGFIALMSAIIISAILLGFAVTSGASSFHSRFNTVDGEFKRVSLGLAESCVNVALLKISEDYNYDYFADPLYVSAKGGVVTPVNPSATPSTECIIKSVVFGAENPATHQKVATIIASGEFNETFSTISTVADVGNPEYSVISPPTCSFSASPTSITQGNSTTLQWSIGGNATSFSIDRNIGGSHTIYNNPSGNSLPDSPTESATYTATVSGPGGTSQCESPRSVIVQPPPSCADTVIILDRRKPLALSAENTAIKGLLDLYGDLSPAPKVGIGSFGAYPNSPSGAASIPDSPSGHLTDIYGVDGAPGSGLYNTSNVLTSTASTSGVGKIDAGITAGNAELSSSIKKVLILISSHGDPGEDLNAILNESDDAKLNDPINPNDNTEIFTISIGTGGASAAYYPLMAFIATGNAIVPAYNPPTQPIDYGTSHQTGSLNQHGASIIPADITDENADGDNFFISPTFTELPIVLQTIGEKVCPAAVPPPPPAPTSTPPPPPPPPNINLGSWQEI